MRRNAPLASGPEKSSRRSATAILDPVADGKIAATDTRHDAVEAAEAAVGDAGKRRNCDMNTIATRETHPHFAMEWRFRPG